MKKAFKTLTTTLSGIGLGYLPQKQAKNVEILPKYGRHSSLLLLQKITGRKNENLLTFCFKFLKKCLSAYTYILLNDLASKD